MKRFLNQLFRQFMRVLLLVLLSGIYSLMTIPLVTDAKSRSLKQSVPLAGFSNITLVSGSTNTNIDRTVNGSDVTYAPNADSASIGVDNIVTVLGNNLNVITGDVGGSAALRMYYGGTIQVKDGNLAVTATSNGSNGQGSPTGHSPSLVSTGAGEISITATGSGSGEDISFEGNGALGGASATGDITINADTVKLGSTLTIHLGLYPKHWR